MSISATIELPEALAQLPQPEREALLRAGLFEAIYARCRQLEREWQTAQDQVAKFEQQYGMTFAEFERTLLPDLDGNQAHEDYNDWFFWQTVLAEKEQLLHGLRSA